MPRTQYLPMDPHFPVTADSIPSPPAAPARWRFLHRTATLALFALPALVISTPANLLPFGLLLLASSIAGADYLWLARQQAGRAGRILLVLALVTIALGLLSLWQFEHALKDVDNRSRFLVMPWALLWVCALRPPIQALWWGALAGLLATFAVAGYQVFTGLERADAWTNAIVLADTALVLMVLLVFCRPPQRWGLIALGMAAGSAVILLSGSRGVWPALLVLFVAMALSVRWKTGRFRVGALAGLVLVAATVVLSVPQLREHTRLAELSSDMQRIGRGDVDSSAGARLERLQVAWDTFRELPLTGVGIGHFDDAMRRLPQCSSQADQVFRCHLGHAHNDLAEWAATQGVPGLLLLLCVYGLPLGLFLRLQLDSEEDGFRGPAAAGVMLVVSYILCGMTQSMFAHQITASTYTALVGVLCGLALVDNAARGSQAPVQRKAASG
nr:O-antigen ligase [Stenotrophomonas pictorum]